MTRTIPHQFRANLRAGNHAHARLAALAPFVYSYLCNRLRDRPRVRHIGELAI